MRACVVGYSYAPARPWGSVSVPLLRVHGSDVCGMRCVDAGVLALPTAVGLL